VAAVAATVAGVVALGIGGASDAAQARAEYQPGAPMGAAVISTFDIQGGSDKWTGITAAVRKELPDARIQTIRGVSDESVDTAQTTETLQVRTAGPNGGLESYYGPRFGTAFLVGASTLEQARLELSKAELGRARKTLAAGGVVVFSSDPGGSKVTSANLRRESFNVDGSGGTKTLGSWTVPATVVSIPGPSQPANAVLSESALSKTGFHAGTMALLVDRTKIGSTQEDALREAVNGIDPNASVYVEQGYHDNSMTMALLLLGAVGGTLVLGGTLTASFLALSDARPDFATLSAVGAAPRMRRFVAASYAGTIGLVGAVLGAAVGFIPGIAVTYPLTSSTWQTGVVASNGLALPDHFLEVPWLLVLGLVIGLPLLTAAVVGAATRSRLPMVSRLS
jgi:putative ABC transport system permease protein